MESESFEADSLDRGTFDGSSPQDLTDAIGQLHGLECAVRRRMLNLIVAYDRREDWKADGATSMVDWASTQLRLPRTQAGSSSRLRQADTLAEMASSSTAADSDPDRATVVVHVDAGSLATNAGPNPEIQDGPNLHFDVARRLACDCRLQVVAHDANGAPLGVGRTTRSVPHWLLRQLKHRDQACRFPGCSRQRFVHAHHIVHWAKGGPTDLDNLLVLCTYHHRLVHEKGWKVRGHPSHAVTFLRPDGSVLATGPPPLRHEIRQRMIPDLAPSGAT